MLIGLTKHLILILINFEALINTILNQLAQQLKIENYKIEKLYYIKIADGVSTK